MVDGGVVGRGGKRSWAVELLLNTYCESGCEPDISIQLLISFAQ